MHLLLRERGLPPAEITNGFGPMGKGLPRPKTCHAGQGGRVVGSPVHGARLLFHDPNPALADSAVEIVVEGLIVGVALAQERAFEFRRPFKAVRQKPDRIAVPGRDIEVGTDLPMIERRDPPHVVVDQWRVGMFAQFVHLCLVEGDHLIRAIAPESKLMRVVGFGHRQIGQVDLIKRVIVHRPEHVPPRTVQRIGGLVFLREPVLKPFARRIRVTQRCVVAVVFIVDLPRSDMRVAAIAFAHEPRNAAAFLAVTKMAEVVVSARSEFAGLPLCVNRQHVRVFVHHPTGRCRCRCAEDNLQSRFAQNGNRTVQPVPCEGAGAGFHTRPCELTDAHPSQTCRHHLGGISCPLVLGPMFGIITDAKRAFHGVEPS